MSLPFEERKAVLCETLFSLGAVFQALLHSFGEQMSIEIVLIVAIVVLLGFVLFKLGSARPRNGDAVDPVAEAEVYVAYGRKNKAIALLEEALRQHPARADIATKLRELKSKS